ncbi:redoxin domain-containing protein [Cohnella faecalis]|uniref:Thiol-disulfide oxidoreductase n=1 Tax=Cohnella faecalis TaxID=2315694 RepID=A0A398CR27_9BACL|nr:redoxin domain-containing protein [Cohnella faecalis]RIE04610.1 thiol-disulfide oxidoreductase [Cohnella faecalis]
MKRHRKKLQYFILIAVIVIGGYAIGSSLFSKADILKIGDKPPEFKLLDLSGQVHSLEEYKGKPLILNFWGTFCPPCRDEMPALQEVYDSWKDKGVQLVGINLSENRLNVDSFIQMVGTNFPILLDKDRMTEKAYGLKQYPTTFFIDAKGKIRDIRIGGPLAADDIEAEIAKLLEAK